MIIIYTHEPEKKTTRETKRRRKRKFKVNISKI